MNVLFVQPYTPEKTMAGDRTSSFEPLALEYLSAEVSDICKTYLIDMRYDTDLLETIRRVRPQIIGFTGYTVHVNLLNKMISQVKEEFPGIIVVVGGQHAIVAPESYLESKPDYIVVGDDTKIFRHICMGDKSDFLEKGTVIKEQIEDSIIYRQAVPIPIADLPLPDRNLSKKYRKHYFSYYFKPVAIMRSSAGCKFRCKFCSLWERYKGQYHTRTPESIVEEIMSIDEKVIAFSDDESFLDIENMYNLAKLIEKKGIKKKYHMFVRADTAIKNKDMFRLWKKIGLVRVFVGVEAVSDSQLKKLNKGTSENINREAIEFLNSLDIVVLADFIIQPTFTKNDFKLVANYIRELKIITPIFTILTPLFGTQLYREVKDQIVDHTYEHYDLLHTVMPTTLPKKEFYSELLNLYKKAVPVLPRLKFLSKLSIIDIFKLAGIYKRLTKEIENLIAVS